MKPLRRRFLDLAGVLVAASAGSPRVGGGLSGAAAAHLRRHEAGESQTVPPMFREFDPPGSFEIALARCSANE